MNRSEKIQRLRSAIAAKRAQLGLNGEDPPASLSKLLELLRREPATPGEAASQSKRGRKTENGDKD